jgi:hypothetical protein
VFQFLYYILPDQRVTQYSMDKEEGEEDVAALDKDIFLQRPLSNQDLLQQVNKIMMMSH